MLSTEKIRALFQVGATISDAEVEEVRKQLYAFAGIALDLFDSDRRFRTSAFRLLPDDERHDVEERAAICEYDAGLGRDEAERLAFEAAGIDRHGQKERVAS